MDSRALLRLLFKHQTWAHAETLDAMAGLDPVRHAAQQHAARRLLNHCHVVSQIFRAHLIGIPHGWDADNTVDTPNDGDLRTALAAGDHWYLDCVDAATPAWLAEPVAFIFTDGDRGGMSRAEMLVHVATHGTYHRGEIGRILVGAGVRPPWDTLAVQLHTTEPGRRRIGHSADQAVDFGLC